jgi:hypothetical protein
MRQGRITAELPRGVSQEEIMSHATLETSPVTTEESTG